MNTLNTERTKVWQLMKEFGECFGLKLVLLFKVEKRCGSTNVAKSGQEAGF